MTSKNKESIAARRAAIRRVRMALEARIQEKLAYTCGATVYQPLARDERFSPLATNREFGVDLENRQSAHEPAKSRD